MADPVSPSPPAQRRPTASAELIEESLEQATLRRAPKIAVFLVLGAALGVIVAAILTFAFGIADGSGMEASSMSAVSYSKGQVFGFLVLVCGVAGVALGGIVALVFDWTAGRRARRVRVDRETVTNVE
ncbi:potassium transporter Trk [Microbacterium elymi]|uniref:Potassium transporter Trk n=1 Tax=Microbacterium elymi TaxID=2909587 RepID=A0ABY5NGU0_9MICO|nr:potassium transporter Trk [Microbacterium elymi]UUT34417.1 potassium transporter Trk [Microbacterium elymi]